MKLNGNNYDFDVMLCELIGDALTITINVDEKTSYQEIKDAFFNKENLMTITDDSGNVYENYTTISSFRSTIENDRETIEIVLLYSGVKDEVEEVKKEIKELTDAILEISEYLYQ